MNEKSDGLLKQQAVTLRKFFANFLNKVTACLVDKDEYFELRFLPPNNPCLHVYRFKSVVKKPLNRLNGSLGNGKQLIVHLFTPLHLPKLILSNRSYKNLRTALTQAMSK